MKKFFTIALCLALMFTCLAAYASEMPFEGTWVQFEDGLEICLPSEWLELEITDDMDKAGVFYAVMSPEGTRQLQLGWADVGTNDLDTVAERLAGAYTDVSTFENEAGTQFATYSDAANDSTGIVALDGEEGMYIFNFIPASDEDYAPIAVAIAQSVGFVE